MAMILSDRDIIEEIEKDRLSVSGITEEQIEPCSIDLTMMGEVKDVAHHQTIESDEITFYPANFYLTGTRETIDLPPDICAMVKGRSSLGRRGLQIHNAGWIDASFRGNLTLEMINLSEKPICIPAGKRVCQVVFMRMESEAINPYGSANLDSKYQGQSGVTTARDGEEEILD